MRKLNSAFTTKYISEAGTKQTNRDYFGFVELGDYICWAIAQGYDNDPDINSAQLAVDTVLEQFTKKPTLSGKKLKQYVYHAHEQLLAQSGKFQLKASILVVASNYKRVRYCLCGNGRLHIFRGNNIFFKSHDQSLYHEMVKTGNVPDDDATGMEESQNLFQYLGKQGKLSVEVSKKMVLEDDDILLLSTWGLWEKISTVEMLDALENAREPLEYLDELQDLFLSKQGQVVNNYTMAAVFAAKTFKEKDNKKKIIKIVLIVAIILLIIGIILFIYFRRVNAKWLEVLTSVTAFEDKGDTYIDDENYDRALSEYDSALLEMKQLKEKTGKKGKANKEINDRLAIKQRVAQLIVDGDKYFDGGKYDQAKLNYQKALEELINDWDFYDFMAEGLLLRQKVEDCDEYQYIQDLMDLAALQAEGQDYEAALTTCYEAKDRATRASHKQAVKDLTIQIAEIQLQVDSQEKDAAAREEQEAQKELEEFLSIGEAAEMEGDMALSAGDYNAAIEYFSQALAIYKEAGSFEKASAVNAKIVDANGQMKQEEEDFQREIAEGYIRAGDAYFSSQYYESAITQYKLARDVYTLLRDAALVAETNNKINLANDKIKELADQQVLLEAEALEAEGDALLKEYDWDEAKIKYQQAQAQYQSINQLDKVLSVERKIAQLNNNGFIE